ncbi:MAG: DsrE family protein [Hyphomonas sp.]|nr:DsrE family protein [Hyphomonas sp.]
MRKNFVLAMVIVMLVGHASAGPEDFKTGPVFEAFGPVVSVPGAIVESDAVFKVAFDVADSADPGAINRRLESAARFLNMHAAAGVPTQNIEIAIIVHGPAALDLVRSGTNANADLVAALIEAGVTIELCGQTAAYRDIAAEDLLPGVTLSLSAMTSHALLQQDGYTLNPF